MSETTTERHAVPAWDRLVGLGPRRWQMVSPMPLAEVGQTISSWSRRARMPEASRLWGPPSVRRSANRLTIRPSPRVLRWDSFEVTLHEGPTSTVIEIEQHIHPAAAVIYGLLWSLGTSSAVLYWAPQLISSIPGLRHVTPLVEALLLCLGLRLAVASARRSQRGQFAHWLETTVSAT